jgi:hypothetical protein
MRGMAGLCNYALPFELGAAGARAAVFDAYVSVFRLISTLPYGCADFFN